MVYSINHNRAVDVLSHGPTSVTERLKILKQPAYANISELGFGVLADFHVKPSGSILLDEVDWLPPALQEKLLDVI